MKFTCPCCSYMTLSHPQRGSYDICEVCFWEDDGVQLEDPDYEGGANKVSLRQGQRNFFKFGACEESMIQHVRPAAINELKDDKWVPFD